MQILSLFLCLSVCLSVSLSKYFFLTLQTRYCIDPPPLRLRRAFVHHLRLPLTLSLVLSLPSPRQGESGPLFPLPSAGNTPPAPSCRPHRRAGSAPSRLHSQLHPLCASLPLPLPSLPPPQALGFSFVKCGLKIIFGKLTPLPLPFPPPSKKHEHLEEQPPERGGCRAVAWQMQQKWLVCVIWKEKKKKKPHMFSMGKMKAWVLSSTSASFRSLFPRADLAVMGWLGTRRALTGACHPFPPPETR